MLSECCEILKLAYERNLITSFDGNVSYRHKSNDHFHISPSDVRKNVLRTTQFILLSNQLDSETQTPRNLTISEGARNLQPSGEWPLHYMLQSILPEDSETRIVLHVHSPMTVAALNKGIRLDNLKVYFGEMGRYTRVAPSVGEIAPVSWELARAVAENLHLDTDSGETSYNIVGIRGHGVVAMDPDPWRAFEHVERLEAVCRIALASL